MTVSIRECITKAHKGDIMSDAEVLAYRKYLVEAEKLLTEGMELFGRASLQAVYCDRHYIDRLVDARGLRVSQ